MNNYCNDVNSLSFTGDTNPSIVFSTDADGTIDWPLGTMLDWMPENTKWKKYWPIWHLKVSYNSA